MSDKPVYGEPIVTSKVRVNFVALEKPDTGHKNSSNKFGLRALLPKKDKAGLKILMDAIEETYSGDPEDLEKHPLLDKRGNMRDGDEGKAKGKEGHAGNYYFNVFSGNQPETFVALDGDEPVECEAKEIYNGCYCSLVLQPAYLPEYEMVTFYLTAVVKLEEGDRFSSGRVDTKQLLANWMGQGSSVPGKKREKLNGKASHVEEDEDEEEEAPRKTKAKKARVEVEEDEEEEEPPRKAKKAAPVEEDEDEEEEEAPVKKREKKGGLKAFDRDQEAEDADEEEEEEEAPRKGKKAAPVEEDEDEDESPKRGRGRPSKKTNLSALLD